ncbi:MAG: ribosome biogenesis GTPase YlqF [Polyangiaceae bacterium]
MAIQWYPGHMTKARRVLAEAIPQHDVVVEVLDGRMPRASENPVVAELRGDKPCIKVLGKSDLADAEITEGWLRHFERIGSERKDGRGGLLAVALTTTRAHEARTKIPELAKRLAPARAAAGKAVRVIVVGIPNVGKSTLINTLMERKVAKVGDEPAVTKAVQKVVLKSGMILSDNPGIMWPKIEDDAGGFRLALGGAIPDTAIDYESVALFGARFFRKFYPELLLRRYKLDGLPEDDMELLEAIGRRRGCLRPGGIVDVHKAADALVHDFRAGALGRISLERAPVPGAAER